MKITTVQQFETLVAELEKNPPLAKGFQRGASPASFKQQWAAICEKLNAIGPPIRDNDGWQKVWRDLKFKVKKRIATNKAECNATGGGRYKQQPLTPLEEGVANLMQFYKQVNPEGVVQGVDLQRDNELEVVINELTVQHEELVELVEELRPSDLSINEEGLTTSTNANLRPQTPATRSRKIKKGDLLKQHTNMQEKMLSDISQKLASVKRNLNDSVRYKKNNAKKRA